MILTEQDLVTLTGRMRRSAQRRVLDAIRVPYRLRPDGTIVVFQRDIEQPAANAPAPAPQLRLPARQTIRKAA